MFNISSRNSDIEYFYQEKNEDGGETDAKLSIFSQIARPYGGYKMVPLSDSKMEPIYWYILRIVQELNRICCKSSL